jgi:hypothetical protein
VTPVNYPSSLLLLPSDKDDLSRLGSDASGGDLNEVHGYHEDLQLYCGCGTWSVIDPVLITNTNTMYLHMHIRGRREFLENGQAELCLGEKAYMH